MVLKKLYLIAAILVLLGGCAINFKPMGAPVKPVSSITGLTQVHAAAQAAGNQIGLVLLAKRTEELLKQAHVVYGLQYENFKEGDRVDILNTMHYDKSRDMAFKLGPAIAQLARDARELAYVSEGIPTFSTEGGAFANQVLAYANLSAKAIGLDIAYPYAGIEWDNGYLSTEHQNEMSAYNVQETAHMKKLDGVVQKFVVHMAAVQASGAAVPSVERSVSTTVHRVTISVIGKASKDDRERLETALREKVAEFLSDPPYDLAITVDLTHLGGIASVSRTLVFLSSGITSMVNGGITFTASMRLNGNAPVPLSMELDAMEAKETGHLVTIATYAILSRAAVVAYGEGWQQPTSKVARQ